MDRVFPILFIIFVKEHSFSMPDVLSKEERSVRMSRIHSASTRPELKLRHSLWHLGFRYRINDKSLPGRAASLLSRHITFDSENGFRAIHLGRYTPPQISVLAIPCLDVPKMTTSRQGTRSTMAPNGADLPR